LTLLDFLSKDCKNNNHRYCDGKWQGLGIEVICNCTCDHNNNKYKKIQQVFCAGADGDVSATIASQDMYGKDDYQ
jgi:hypothetical protein